MYKLPIDKLDDRPWDIVAAFKDLHQRLALLDYQDAIIAAATRNYTTIDDIQPDHIVGN